MQLLDLLRRLLPGRRTRSAGEESRHDAATRLEKATQAHYRRVTQSDAQGRPTNPDQEPGAGDR